MELEQPAIDLDWDDDIDESLLDDDFDAVAEFETEFTPDLPGYGSPSR